ncbi:MAG: aminoglycoside phosphotransferase family protein [Actinomycetota bacterium]|nr:aminoglycoside phosphotransferase family protein [Actinomycetota bacterium]
MAATEATTGMVIFERVARLFLPRGDLSSAVIEADKNWSFDRSSFGSADVIVWGRPPLESGAGLLEGLTFTRQRTTALMSLRSRRGGLPRLQQVHRWPPPAIGTNEFKNAAKRALIAGAVVELSTVGHYERVVDRALAQAGVDHEGTFIPASGGSLRAFVKVGITDPVPAPDAPPEQRAGALFRIGIEETGADPGPAARALEALGKAGVRFVPRMLGRGTAEGTAWTLESLLIGRRPRHVSTSLLQQVAGFGARLPRRDETPTAMNEDFAVITSHLPQVEGRLAVLKKRCAPLMEDLGSVGRHGDLWAGNLLVQGEDLTGIVDWDAWHDRGVPGTDLLNACSYVDAPPESSLGDRFVRRPWTQTPFSEVSRPYWRDLGVNPSASALEMVAVAWWAGQVAANVERMPHLVNQERWLRTNVFQVLDALGR